MWSGRAVSVLQVIPDAQRAGPMSVLFLHGQTQEEAMDRNLGQWTHAILRISAGALFMQHGIQKLFGMFGGMGAPGATAPPRATAR